MKITTDFVKAVKIAFGVVILTTIFSCLLAYFKIHGIYPGDPSRNSISKIALITLKEGIGTGTLWILVGIIIKDYRSAYITLAIALLQNLVSNLYLAWFITNPEIPAISRYFLTFSNILPYLVFGILHFEWKSGIKLILVWAVVYGLSGLLDTHGFENMMERFFRFFDIREPFEIHIETGENGYMPIYVLKFFVQELFLIINLGVFWWMYEIIRYKTNILTGLKTIYNPELLDRVSYSILYWSFRLILFVVGFSIIDYLTYIIKFPPTFLVLVHLLFFTIGLIIVASIYRNFLASAFILRNSYLNGLFVLLNLPVIHIFAWVYSLLNFKPSENSTLESTSYFNRFKHLQSSFVQENRNNGWKIIIIILAVISLLLQLNNLGFDFYVSSLKSSLEMMIYSIISFFLLLWFLYYKTAYLPLLIASIIVMVELLFLKSEEAIPATLAITIINLVLFYGMFYYDDLLWENEDSIENTSIMDSERIKD